MTASAARPGMSGQLAASRREVGCATDIGLQTKPPAATCAFAWFVASRMPIAFPAQGDARAGRKICLTA